MGTRSARCQMHGRRFNRTRPRRWLAFGSAAAATLALQFAQSPAEAQLCPDVPHDPDPIELQCSSQNERWAVVDPGSGLVTNVVGWNGTNRWRPPAGQIAIDLPDGSPVGPGWWMVDGSFISDSFERNLTARADILSVHLSWSNGGLGSQTQGVVFTVTVQPTGSQHTTSDNRLTLDPLKPGVAHSFTVTAQLPDGRTVQGPTVSATPKEDPDPDCLDRSVARECRKATNWAHVVKTTGYVDNVSVCTWEVCGDPSSSYRQSFNGRGILLIELDGLGLAQRPGPGWWMVDGKFVRDSFERNVSARADILSVHLSWSTGGLGTETHGVRFTVAVQPTGQRFTVTDSRLTIDPLEAGVLHTFTVTATRPDGSTVSGPVVTATPQADPDPGCTDRSVARECRAATNWAVVHPRTGMVENVIVCTPWQCGADGAWGGVMPSDTPWPGHLLIELKGSGGIGWQHVGGRFVDVRPAPDDEAIFDTDDSDPASPSASGEPDREAEAEGSMAEGEAVSLAGPSESPAGRVSDEDTEGVTPPTGVADAPSTANPIRRFLGAIASFFSGLFGR